MTDISRNAAAITLCLLSCVIGCNKRPQGISATPIDACALLKSDEIQAIQGSSVEQGKGSTNANNGLHVAQCYYAAKESSKSVVVTVTQHDGERVGKRTVKQIWGEMFGKEAKEERDREKEHEEGEETAAPQKIDGVGDEAYWTGARFGGALYVLAAKKEAFLRISVGGADTEESKIEKSKTLARKALERL